jgi:His/Glu/Gln/Arg/opine family amino acid ABC transporter permease subunit
MLELNFRPVFDSLDQLLAAAVVSLVLGIVAMVLALVVGTLGAALSQSRAAAWRRLVIAYVDLFRGTPLLVQVLAFFFVPTALGLKVSPYTSGILALSLYYGAYITEIVRGALEGVPAGHLDAGRSLGMPAVRIFWRIQLPQALAVVISPLAGQFARLFKASSLLSVIGVAELTLRGQFVMTRTYAPIETWLVVAAIYFAFYSVVIVGAIWLERLLTRGRA